MCDPANLPAGCKDRDLLCFAHVYPQPLALFGCTDVGLMNECTANYVRRYLEIEWERYKKALRKYYVPCQELGFTRGTYESLLEMVPSMWQKIYIPTKTCPQMSLAALFIVAKNTEHIPDFHQLLKK